MIPTWRGFLIIHSPIMEKPNYIYFLGIILAVLGILIYTISDTEVKEDYTQEIRRFREEKEVFFKKSKESPIEDKDSFKGLAYYSPTSEYRLEAKLEPITDTLPNTGKLTIRMTDGKEEVFIKHAYAVFQLKGKQRRLLLLKHANDESLFLPFTDKTNGFETYGGGRYLDLEPQPDKQTIMLDFNLAYNPFCAYNTNYSCPIPPTENHLDIEIKAGEKEFVHDEKK